MDKDIMKNDKVVEDILQEFSAMREKSQISYVWKEVHNRYGIDIDVWLGDKLRSLTKPTTDIDEVREAFRDTFGVAYQIQKINDIEENVLVMDVNYVDIDRVFDFFLPYLKGGE